MIKLLDPNKNKEMIEKNKKGKLLEKKDSDESKWLEKNKKKSKKSLLNLQEK